MIAYGYIIWGFIFFPLWLLFFLSRKDLRKPMITLGLIFAPQGAIYEFNWLLKDYWNPLVSMTKISFVLQEMAFIFIMVGVLFLYLLLFVKKLGNKIDWNNIIIPILTSLITFEVIKIIGIKSIYALYLSQTSTAFYIWLKQPTLIKVSLFNFAYGCLLAFIGFSIFQRLFPDILGMWWNLEKLSGIFIFTVPLEEILWLGFIGIGFGILPQFVYEEED